MIGATTVSPATTTITDDDILCFPQGHPQAGMPMHEWLDEVAIINKVDVAFDFNVPGLRANDFGRRFLYTAHQSTKRHAVQRALTIPLLGVRQGASGDKIADGLALSVMQRYGFPAQLLRLSATYRAHTLRVAETIHLTSALIEGPLTGELGLENESFEVLGVTIHLLLRGHVELLLLWTGAIESSAAPVRELINLVPGISTFNLTDVPVPFAGSATVTTEPATRSVRLGFKHLTYRLWHCLFNTKKASLVGKIFECVGEAGPQSYVNRSFTGSVHLRPEYKTSTALDQAGTGGNPATGWVPLSNRSWAFTAAAETDLVTAVGHQLANDQRVYLTGASLPVGLSAHTIYYVRDRSGDTFKLAATEGGAAIELTTDGSGTVFEASKIRGAVALAAASNCQASDIHPSVPGEDFWSEFYETLGGSPATYNIRLFFTAAGQQADPCPALNPSMCDSDGCTGGTLAASILHTDQKAVTLDYTESIS